MTDARSPDPATARKRYYQARAFSTYCFANAIFNVVVDSFSYLHGIEDIPPPLCQRSCRRDRMESFGGARTRTWPDTDKLIRTGW